jgi:hypothetical protein
VVPLLLAVLLVLVGEMLVAGVSGRANR